MLSERLRMRRLWNQAIRQSDLRVLHKLQLRLLLVNTANLDAMNDFLVEKSSLVSTSDFNTMADGRIIELILEHLPEIIEFIKILIGLFG